MDLKGKTAKDCCEVILKDYKGMQLNSEEIQQIIVIMGGNHYKVSNLERRMRESDKIKSVKVPGKNYVKYSYKGDV